jgi:hypothetical protein
MDVHITDFFALFVLDASCGSENDAQRDSGTNEEDGK